MPKKIQDFLTSASTSLGVLGIKRLVLLGLIGATFFFIILFSSFYLTRPEYETLYIGLGRDDVNRIGVALGEIGIDFDVAADGGSMQVPLGMAEKARMLLAEKGLPTSSNAGYELFDKMGSLGLTSFMQEITKQRALEGEIARTVQTVLGVRAARIHVVLPDKGSFRRIAQNPTASVVLRIDNSFSPESARAIRHMVAAAVPSLEARSVTVLDTTGQLLASGDDVLSSSSPVAFSVFERKISAQIEHNVQKQLAPYLGLEHFQTSIRVKLDMDRRQTNETIYDPDSQVARSVRNVREQNESQNKHNSDAVSVEQNIPQEEISSVGGDDSSDRREHREEITNYEISSKTISVTSDGYQIENLAIAVIVDRGRLLTGKKDEEVEKHLDNQIMHIRQIVTAAAGLDKSRGDILHVAAVDFLGTGDFETEAERTLFWEMVQSYIPTLIKVTAMLFAVLLVIFLGIRPLLRELSRKEISEISQSANATSEQRNTDGSSEEEITDILQSTRLNPQTKLERMAALDEERFIDVLQNWMREEKEQQQV